MTTSISDQDSSKPTHVRFQTGDRVFAQGEVGDTAYIVVVGRVDLLQHHDGRRVEVGVVGPGEIFGEMAVLDGGRRSVTATAAEDCELVTIPQPVFRQKLNDADPVLRAVLDMFIKNIRSSPRLFLRRPRSFRDHVKQMASFSWNMRRFAGRLGDDAMVDNMLDTLDRLDGVLDDLANVAELTADQRHDFIVDEELAGVPFSQVIGSAGRRKF